MFRKSILTVVGIPIFIAGVFSFTPRASHAEALDLFTEQAADPYAIKTNDLVDKKAVLLRYGYFSDDGMNEAYTNQYGYPCMVTVTGGTVTQIDIDAVNTNLTSGMFIVAPDETITITYSSVPTWVWYGL